MRRSMPRTIQLVALLLASRWPLALPASVLTQTPAATAAAARRSSSCCSEQMAPLGAAVSAGLMCRRVQDAPRDEIAGYEDYRPDCCIRQSLTCCVSSQVLEHVH